LRDLLGAEELRELLDPAVIEALELELQRLTPERKARHADDLHDLLADLGPLDDTEIVARSSEDPRAWVDALMHERRAIRGGTRMGRRRCAAVAAPPLARRAPPRGRAGRRGHVRALPVGLAGRRARSPRHGRAGRGARAAAGCGDPGIGARARRPAGAGGGLQ